MVKKKGNKENLSPIMKRMITVSLLVPFVLSVLIVGSPMVEMMVLVVGILLSWEWAKIVPSKKPEVYMGSYIFTLVAAICFPREWAVLAMVITTLFVYCKAKGEGKRGLLTLGVPYISLGLGCLVWYYQAAGLLFLLWLLFVVWGMDSGGYLVGSKLKGPKLMPKVSPNKTWSGLVGGLIFSAIGGSLIVWYTSYMYKDVALMFVNNQEYARDLLGVYVYLGLIAIVFGFISQVGDLIESAIKRNVKVKDSSNLIPGHGGVFDRIDALMFVAPFAYLWFIW